MASAIDNAGLATCVLDVSMTRYYYSATHTHCYTLHNKIQTYRLSALAMGIFVSLSAINVKAEEPEQSNLPTQPNQTAQVNEQQTEVGSNTDSNTQTDQYEQALIALRLKKAVEQGKIDASVLEEYLEKTINDSGDNESSNQRDASSAVNDNSNSTLNNDTLMDISSISENDRQKNSDNDSDAATSNIQTFNENESSDEAAQAYQPEDAFEQAANDAYVPLTKLPKSSIEYASPQQIDELLQSIDLDAMSDFDAPVAKLDSNAPPLGLNSDIESEIDNRFSSMLNPDISDIVNVISHRAQLNDASATKTHDDASDTLHNMPLEGMSKNPERINARSEPLTVDDTRTSIGNVPINEDLTNVNAATNNNVIGDDVLKDDANNITASEIKHHQAHNLVTQDSDSNNDFTESQSDVWSQDISNDNQSTQANNIINPDDYLPEYDKPDANTSQEQAIENAVVNADLEGSDATTDVGFFEGLYNRLFNGGYARLPKIDASVYLQDETKRTAQGEPVLIAADDDVQPMNNIKAAIEDITVESVSDFSAALPRLKQEALNAAQAVGYYDISLRFEQPSRGNVNIIIERLGEPVTVNSRLIDIRGEGEDNSEFEEIRQTAIPFEDDVFNHGAYQETKLAIASVSDRYGYFDGDWLNKSVDVILPDNTADIDLIYDTGSRYDFGEVIFYTYDENTGQLTTDAKKLPLREDLLDQLYRFDEGDDYYRPLITEFTNSLSATRYFNTVNVEVIKPIKPDEADATLAFESGNDNNNAVTGTDTSLDKNDAVDNAQAKNSLDPSEQIDVTQPVIQSDDISNHDHNDIYNVGNEGEARPDDLNVSTNNATTESNTTDNANIEPIEFLVDEETSEKLQAVKAKSERLISLPDDRVLDEQDEEARNILGKISNAISNIAEKILPDGEDTLADVENGISANSLDGRISPEQAYKDKIVPIYVFVMADKPKDAQLGIGYGTDTGMRVVAQLDHNLINQDGYQAGIRVGASEIRKSVDIHASRPWNHPLNDTLNADLAYEQESINQGEGNLDLETDTLKVGFNRSIRPISGWDRTYSLSYRLDELESGITGANRENLPVPFNRDNSKFTQQSLLLGYALSKVQTDNIANPTRGFSQYYSLEVGSDSVFTDTNMMIARARLGGVYSFGEMNKHQLVGSLDGGYIWADDFEDVPYKQRFFAGGDRSLRGYDYQSLSAIEKGYLIGGQVLALGSAEYNYEFRPNFRAAVFADVGNAYDTDFDTETKLGLGAGIRWASPVGMVRLDLAAGVLEEGTPIRLHFFIGSPLQ